VPHVPILGPGIQQSPHTGSTISRFWDVGFNKNAGCPINQAPRRGDMNLAPGETRGKAFHQDSSAQEGRNEPGHILFAPGPISID